MVHSQMTLSMAQTLQSIVGGTSEVRACKMAVSIACAHLMVLSYGCRPDPSNAKDEAAPSKDRQVSANDFVFPLELRAEDEAVNDAVTMAMRCCTRGDYDGFRVLWTAKEEPISRDEYNEGFRAVRKIEVQALQKLILAGDGSTEASPGELVYVVSADMTLDPKHRAARGESRREVVLLLRSEGGQWRLARAPKPVREWLKSRINKSHDDDAATQKPVQKKVDDHTSQGDSDSP